MLAQFTGEGALVVGLSHMAAMNFGPGRADCRHLLWSLASSGTRAGVILSDAGITAGYVERELLRHQSRLFSSRADMLEGLDCEVLAAIGIDLGVVRARLEPPGENPHPPCGGDPPSPSMLERHVRDGAWRRIVHFRHPVRTRKAERCLRHAVHDAEAFQKALAGPEHILRALTATPDRSLTCAWKQSRQSTEYLRAVALECSLLYAAITRR